MKNLFTYLKALWGAWGNLQSKDVRHDCRLTVGSPSGLDAKWKQNPFMRFAVVLTLIFTIGSGNVWGADIVLNKAAISDLSNNSYKPNFESAHDFTVSSKEFTGAYIAYNAKKAPSDGTTYYAAGQFIQMKKTDGYIINKDELSLSSLTIVYFPNANGCTISSGTTSGSLSNVSASSTTTQSTTLSLDGGGTTTKSLTKATYDLSGKKYVKIKGNTTNALYVYSITISYTTGSTKTLSSIAISSYPTKMAYVAGETFDKTGAIVTATYSDATTANVSASTTWTPSSALSAGSQTMTASYTEGVVTKTATTTVNVYGITLQAQDEDGNAIGVGGPGAPTFTAATSTITAAANSGNYVFKQWSVTNATAASTSTTPTTISSPTGNVTVTAVYYKPITITYKANGTTFTTQTYARGGTLAFPASDPDGDDYSCTGKTFVGWVGEANKDYSSASTPPTYATAGGSVTAAATYYAVFADASGDPATYIEQTSNITTEGIYVLVSEYDGDYYYLPNEESSSNPTLEDGITMATSAGVTKLTNTITDGMLWEFTEDDVYDGYYHVRPYGNSSIGLGTTSQTGDKLRITSTYVDDSFSFTTTSSSQKWDIYNGYYLAVYSASAWRNYSNNTTNQNGVFHIFKQTGGATYSDYATTCCTELGTINGSVSWSNAATAVVSWDNLDHVSSWTVKYKTHAAGAYTTWAGEQTVYTTSTTNDSRKVTITGLTPCTNYDFQIIANPASGYCDKDQTIEDSQTHNWTVTSTGVTNATASPAIPSTTCSGFSTTISPATGYALPADITVTNASKSWNSSTGALTISSVTGNVSITITPTCVSPVITADPADADYYVGDSPDALSVSATLASGTLTYLWKVSTNEGSTWSDAAGTNNTSSYSGASLSTASAGTLKFKCIVGNSQGGCTVESEVATITVANASYFPNGKTIFIQAESSSAWSDANYDCVKAWFHTAGGSETAQTTYWLFDATGGDSGKKLFAAIVPATGDLPYLDIQRFTHDCSDWRNKNGGCSYSDANGSNTIRSTGNTDTHDAQDDYIRWNATGVTMNLMSSDAWLTPVASMTDQGSGVWSGTYEYTPSNTSTEYVIATNYNGNIGNTGSNSNATLSGMVVGSTYNVTATLDIKDHSLEMSKTFVKGTVHFDLQGHGLAISDLTNVTAGSKISAPSPAPSATGYTFGGWFTDAECTDEWTFASDEVNETMTLYAKWTANVYTITKTLTNVSNTGLPASFTYTGATTTALNSTFTVDATNFFLPSSIAVTMGGTPLTAGTDYTYNNSTGAFTFDRIISGNIVITASATAKLKSIAITTQPTTRKYFAGESFRSTGAVVTATMGDGSTKTVSATWTPSGALSAGTSQTVTASYSEGGIDQTATTTIDVYSVTVNKKNEDGDAIDVAGVTATWTVGTKALAAGIGSTKYAFKEWQVTGATAASTTSASTTLSNPTANVVVNAVFWKPRVVKWSVNGDDSYATGGPTTEVAYNGTISTIPTAPSGLVCASTFVAWTDAAHNNGTTAKASTSYYESKLFTAANQFPNITAETTTFYAVFAEGTGAAVNTTMWGETWTDATVSNGSSGQSDANPDDNCSTTKGTTIYGAASISYTQSDNSNVYCRNENSAGGTAPELYIKSSNSWTISGIPTGGAATLSLTYATNKTPTVTVSTTELGKTPTISGANKDKTITTDGASTITIQFSTSENTRVDNVELRVATVSLTNYVTECDANIVKVTYDANGGSTSCTNTTTDKTEDFTVCSSAPTRDYYTFAGWLCSADSKTYAASATIPAAAIDADFTLTAQWTPVTYNITYELDGGTNNVGNPATYNVTTATITLQDPTKGHDRFDGWFTDDGVWSDEVTEIPLGSHGDITLYAKWSERHEIVFDYSEGDGGTTTTIYRADDENLEDAVAGMGSVPDDPDAPIACSSKVFVGWSESTIDDETDTKPSDLMKSAVGTVNEDKEFHAVWAIVTPTDPPATYAGTGVFEEITSMGDLETGTYYVLYGYDGESTHGALKNAGSGTAGEEAGTNMTVSTSSITNPSTDIVWKLGGTTDAYTLYNQSASKYIEITTDDAKGFALNASATTSYKVTVEDGHGFFFKTNKTGCTRGISIYTSTSFRCYALANAKNLRLFKLPTNTVTAYCTSCCATNVTLSQNSPSNGTIEFGKTKVGTCGDKEVSLTITPAAGYQLHTYEVATGSGKVATKSVNPAISLDNNSSAAQNITLTFADEANGAYDVTASFSLMTVTSWTWTMHDGGGAIPDPLNLYVGQRARLDVAYTPSGVDASKKTYTRDKTNTYINWVGSLYSGYSTIEGRASTGENTTPVIFTHADGPETIVNVKVLPLPLTHFEDLVHGKAFADVEATLVDNALSATKTTPTSDDWVTPNANSCEENHLHLVGWIREDWPALVAYLAGTGDAPTTTAIVGAGNDGSGQAYFFSPGASINVQTFNDVTFYAVWAEIK